MERILTTWEEHNEVWATWPDEERQYIPHPVKWLEGERWLTDPPGRRDKPLTKLQRLQQASAALKEMADQGMSSSEQLDAIFAADTQFQEASERARGVRLLGPSQQADIEDAEIVEEPTTTEGDGMPDNRAEKKRWLSDDRGQLLIVDDPEYGTLARSLLDDDAVDFRDVKQAILIYKYSKTERTLQQMVTALHALARTGGVTA